MPELHELRTHQFSHLGRENKFIGEFYLRGEIKISSEMEGKIFAENPDTHITIDPYGSFSGEVKCVDIEILGNFSGKLHARGKVVLQSSATVNGEIHCENIIIYPGAQVNMEGSTF